MSYSVSLTVDGEEVDVPHFMEGPILPIGGTSKADMSITYNYAEVYAIFEFSIWDLNGRVAKDMVQKMKDIIARIPPGARKFTDYWAPTPGNAVVPLKLMVEWSELYPDAIWHVS